MPRRAGERVSSDTALQLLRYKAMPPKILHESSQVGTTSPLVPTASRRLKPVKRNPGRLRDQKRPAAIQQGVSERHRLSDPER
jgi:hypothetical protein